MGDRNCLRCFFFFFANPSLVLLRGVRSPTSVVLQLGYNVVIALLQSDFSFATILQFPNRRGLSGNYQHENKGKDRPARTPHVAFVVASHYHLQIIFLHLQAYLDKFSANPTASLNT